MSKTKKVVLGPSLEELAREIGVSHVQILEKIKELGLKVYGKGHAENGPISKELFDYIYEKEIRKESMN